TRLEKAIRRHFAPMRFWTKLMEADRRSLVGRYSAVILRVADDLPTDQPLATVSGGLDALVDVVPVWEGQIKVSQWDTDPKSMTYGDPLMFEYDEGTVGAGSGPVSQGKARKLTI